MPSTPRVALLLILATLSACGGSPSTTVAASQAGAATPQPPGTPPPAAPGLTPLPVGGSGSGRFEMGTDLLTGGLTVVDPAAGEPTVEGFVVVTFGSLLGPAPADAVVTLNGVALVRLPPPSSGLYWQVDPAGPQPTVGSGGQIVLVATATDPSTAKSIQRTLVLPCPSDIQVTLTPAPGSALVPGTPVHLSSTADLLFNQGVPLFAPYRPKATLWGYEPATRALAGYGAPTFLGTATGFEVDLPGCPGDGGACTATAAGGYLLDLRWPGPGVLDGETGGYCQLAKRWIFTK